MRFGNWGTRTNEVNSYLEASYYLLEWETTQYRQYPFGIHLGRYSRKTEEQMLMCPIPG